MKRLLTLVLSIVLCVGLLAGCGKDYTTEESTVFILDDGKVVTTDVEEFDENVYDKAALEEYIDAAIEAYVADGNDADSVKLDKFTVEEGKAILTIKYASAEDYVKFNGKTLFSGSVAEALAAGYEFDGEFASINGENVSACDVNDFINEAGLKVAIVEGEVNVNVDGEVLYASVANTKYVSADTVAVIKGMNLLKGAMEATTEAEPTEADTENTVPSTEEESSGMSEDMGSVSEDELLAESTETEEKVEFHFDEEDTAETEEDAVYTFIFFK